MLANTASSYGSIAKVLHWLTALLILSIIPLGLWARGAPFGTDAELARKALLFSIHKTLGVAVFFVALARSLWALTQTRPGALHPDRRAETLLADIVHWLLYGSLVLAPLTGWTAHAATTGFAPIWWPLGQSLPFVPRDPGVAAAAGALHLIFTRVLIAALILHVAGVLKHLVVDDDSTLWRIWFGRPSLPQVAPHRTPLAAPALAIAVWAAAVGAGVATGLTRQDAPRPPTAALESVSSDWQVQGGEIAIGVRQFGRAVEGRFADWTAAIRFDPEAQGAMGDVEATISIPSLTLGSVTEQAMDAQYFDAESYPTARFSGTIRRAEAGEGYLADGTLTLKGRTVPVRLPFTLDLQDGTATVSGEVRLDRRDFGIGAAEDDGNVGFGVDVRIALTATREG